MCLSRTFGGSRSELSQISSSVLFMVTCASREQLHAALEELSLPTLEAESREGHPGDTWVSS